MKQLIISVVCAIILHSCGSKMTMQEWRDDRVLDTLSFFGKPVVMDDRTEILHQIRLIAENDDMLTYKTGPHFRVLTVGRVKFDVNIYGYGIELLTDL